MVHNMMHSIAMVTYNGEKFIREQIDSILKQTLSNFELIICDDCSTDKTYSILQEYAQKDNRIKLFRNNHNLGFLKNFEKALSQCSGDYIACCDQDDIWTANHLEILTTNLGTNDCIGANALIIDEQGFSINKTVKDSLSIEIIPESSNSIFKHECFYNLIQGTACLFKKELLSHILPFPQNIKFHDHWIALNAAIQNGCKYTSEIVLSYRTHKNNVTGFHKFNLFHAIKTAFQSRKIRQQLYEPNITMLKAIQKNKLFPKDLFYINQAIQFYENLASGKNRIHSILFYIKNYNEIALCFRKKWKLFLYRLFCLAIFGIML